MQLPTARLKPGMILAEDVRDAAGRVLMAAGRRLTDADIQSLQRRRIAAAAVRDEPADSPANPAPGGRGLVRDLDAAWAASAPPGEPTPAPPAAVPPSSASAAGPPPDPAWEIRKLEVRFGDVQDEILRAIFDLLKQRIIRRAGPAAGK